MTSLVCSDEKAHSKIAFFSASDLIEAKLVPSCAHILFAVGSASTLIDEPETVVIGMPFWSVILKQELPAAASQVYPGGQFGVMAVQKYGFPRLQFPAFHLNL